MKTVNKIWLILATVFTLSGIIFFTLAMNLAGWDFMKLSTDKFETETYEFQDDFENISINVNTADIKFLPGETENTQILLREHKKENHTVTTSDNTLKISVDDQRHWTDYISFFSFEAPKITVYLPNEEYISLKIDTDTGDIEIPKEFKFQNIEIKGSTSDIKCLASAQKDIKITVSTGDITAENINCGGDIITKVSTGKTNFTNVTCKNLKSDGDTGDMILNNVLAEGKFDIVRDTGDIRINASDAAEIEIETDTGDIKGTLKTPKIFITDTDTGRIDVPKSTEGGKCKLTTDTGDIKIMIK